MNFFSRSKAIELCPWWKGMRMKLDSSTEISDLALQVLMGRKVLAICVEELEWEIRFRYTDKMPTKRSRIKGYVKKHIAKLKQRDSIFYEYFRVLELLERTNQDGICHPA